MRCLIFFVLATVTGWAQVQSEYNPNGRLCKETFPNGKSINIFYDEANRVWRLSISDLGDILYSYEQDHLISVSRFSPEGKLCYAHSYTYDLAGHLIAETLIGDLGEIRYGNFSAQSPCTQEILTYNPLGQITESVFNGTSTTYSYTLSNELICSRPIANPLYDQAGNVIQENDTVYRYDDKGHLIQVNDDIYFTYDERGRRLSKTTAVGSETYLYFGNHEIAIFDERGVLKQLRVPGFSCHDDFLRPIAIETNNAIYAPIHNFRCNISALVNIDTHAVTSIVIDPYGPVGALSIPWAFAGKHYDEETGLVYFGSRYYNPRLQLWLSPDPLRQGVDFYAYCLNNPLYYFDPDGRFAVALVNIGLGAGAAITLPFWGTAAIASVAAGWAVYEGAQIVKKWNHQDDLRLTKGKEGRQKDGTPQPNGAQNDQFRDAVREVEKKLGKKLNDTQQEKLHDAISGMNYGYHDIVEEGWWMFHD